MTTTAIAIETTQAEEQTTTDADRDTRENQRPTAQTDARPVTGTAYLPSATSGANTINWK
jgi:hypothetical protein